VTEFDLVFLSIVIFVLALLTIAWIRYSSNRRCPKFIRKYKFRVASNFAKQKNFSKLGWRTHKHHISGQLTADITTNSRGLKIYSSTKPESEDTKQFSFNHLGLNLKPVKKRTGIAVEVDIDTIEVKSCSDSKTNLARFVTGAVFFSNGPKRKGDNWYNSIFVATGIGMVDGNDRPFDGLGAFAVILHCKDTCLVLEEYSPAGKEAAEVMLLKSLGPVRLGETSTIGVEFVEMEKKVIFYRDNEVYEHKFNMDMGFTNFNPFLKFDVANFAAPCNVAEAVSRIGVTVRKVYVKTGNRQGYESTSR
jgi:hypothetical protein